MNFRKQRKLIHILLVCCIVFIIGLCICSVSFVGYVGKRESDRTQQYMLDITEKSAIAINDKINGYASSLHAVSAAISSFPYDKELGVEIMRHEMELGEFSRVGYIYADGESYIIDRELGELSGVDFRGRDYYKESIKGESYVTDPFQDYWTDSCIVVMSVPIYENGDIIGVLCGVNRADIFTDGLEQSYSQSDTSFRVMNSAGSMLYNLDSAEASFSSNNIFDIEYEYFSDIDAIKENFSNGQSGTARFKEYDKREEYMAYAPLETNDWYITTIMPTYSVTQQMNTMMVFVAVLMILMITTVILLIVTSFQIQKKDRMEKYNLAFQDRLTGCSNKSKFIIDLQQNEKLYDGKHFVLVYDIKNFTAYNKIFGYQSGDELILAVNGILKDSIRADECFARAYAERFVLLLHAGNEEAVNKRTLQIFDQVDKYMEQNGKLGYALISRCGIYRIQTKDKDLSMDTFIDYANQARMQIEDIYKSRYHYFDAEVYDRNSEAAKIESRMHAALENKEFLLYLQPKYAILHEIPVLCGAESLVWWNFAGETMVYPDKFIPRFEQNGFIIELDMYMLEQSCIVLRKWMDEGRDCVPISVNQSRLHMFNPAYLKRILAITKKYAIPHNLLDFEITESAVMNDVGQVREQFSQLRKLGFSTSMDDFGSGFSSLNLLKDIEADTIKIDKGFFDTAFHSEEGKYIVKSVISLVKGLGYYVVAEGIETAEQVDFLKTCQCDSVQGYYFGRPQALSEFEEKHMVLGACKAEIDENQKK